MVKKIILSNVNQFIFNIFSVSLSKLICIFEKNCLMKSILSIGLIASVFVSACSSSSDKTNTKEVKKTHISIQTSEVQANKLLTVDIDGMVCEKGCGSSIRKELMNTNAIESCEFDFQTDRKTNTVKIAFDKDKITVDKIVSILNTMNEKQFKVLESHTNEFITKNTGKKSEIQVEESSEESSSVEKEEAKIQVSDSTNDTPNLLQLFSRLITG